LFTSFSEWAAKHTAGSAFKQARSWKPNVLVPATDSATIQGSYTLIRDITYPKGSAVLMGIKSKVRAAEMKERLSLIAAAFQKDDVFSTVSVMKTKNFADGVNFGTQALGSSFFGPNIIFLNMLEPKSSIADYPLIIKEARLLEMGVLLYMPHPRALLGQKQIINIWIKNRGPKWNVQDGRQNPNLAILTAYKLKLNWNANLRLITVIDNVEETKKAKAFLNELTELARMPIHEKVVMNGSFKQVYTQAPLADINVFGLFLDEKIDFYQKMALQINTSCLFVMDSGHENILA
jgi:hypothetical protein